MSDCEVRDVITLHSSPLLPVQGEGCKAPAELQLIEAPDAASGCRVVRLLREVSRKELAMYAFDEDLPAWSIGSLQAAQRTPSINDVCNAFASNLAVRTSVNCRCLS